MDVNVISTIIGDILQKPTEQLVIPSYQRSYSWTKEQCKDLFKDIKNSQNGDNAHFIGTIIRCKRNTSEYDIVDGQQRLTSISLLLAAIRDIDIELETGIDSKSPVIQKYIEPHNPNTGQNFFKIAHASEDQEFTRIYKSFVGTNDISESDLKSLSKKSRAAKRVKEAFEFFKEEVRELVLSSDIPVVDDEITHPGPDNPSEKALRNLLGKIINLKVVNIELKDIPAAYRVFNALNSRGLDLKQSDLIKSHILGNLPDTNSEDVNLVKWGEIIGVIEEHNNKNSNEDKSSNEEKNKMPSMNEDDFFYHYLISRGSNISAKKETFAEYEKSIDSSIAAEETLELLSKDIYLYRITFDSGEKIPGEKRDKRDAATWDKSLVALNIFGLIQHRPLILAILRRYFDNQDKAIRTTVVNDFLGLIEKSHFVLTAINVTPGNKFTTMYNSQARKVFSLSKASGAEGNQNINTVYNYLLQKYQELMESVPENVFVDKFIKKINYENHALVRYVLDHYQSKTFGQPGNNLTIEHIIPKSRIKEVSKDSNISSEAKDYYAKIINSPGNLILLRREDNENCENMSLKDKLEFYKTLDYANDIPQEIFAWSGLAEDKVLKKIEERTEEMAKHGFNTIWNIRNIQPKPE
jgi:hypothetical protein